MLHLRAATRATLPLRCASTPAVSMQVSSVQGQVLPSPDDTWCLSVGFSSRIRLQAPPAQQYAPPPQAYGQQQPPPPTQQQQPPAYGSTTYGGYAQQQQPQAPAPQVRVLWQNCPLKQSL